MHTQGYFNTQKYFSAGATTPAQQVLAQWEEDKTVCAAYLHRPDVRLTAGFLRLILDAFGLEGCYRAAESEAVLCSFLRAQQAAGQSCVLVIDEAQCLSAKARAALHRLLAQKTGHGPLLQVVLFGRPPLARKRRERVPLGSPAGYAFPAGYTHGYATNLGAGGHASVAVQAEADGYFRGALA